MLLGLDLGTSRIKALLLDREGNIRGQAAVPTPFAGGEMTVPQLGAALAAVVGRLGGARAGAAAVGIAGMAESGAPLAAGRNRPLAPVIAWYDTRGAEVVARLERAFGPELDRAIGQRVRVVSSVAKLGWLVDHGVGPVARWLGVPELALFALTGCQVTEFSLAARTGAYHVGERCYLPEVAAAIGVAAGVFPEVAAAGTPMGRVTARAAAWLGAPEGIPVTLAGHDHLAAWVGAGAQDHDLLNSVGTAETVVADTAERPDVDAALARRVAVSMMPGGDRWALLAGATRAGLVLGAVAEALGLAPPDLDRAAESFVDQPGLAGVGWAPAGPADRAGLPSPHGGRSAASERAHLDGDQLVEAALRGAPLDVGGAPAGAVWYSVLAALAERTWDAFDRLAGLAPAGGPERLVVVGGGSQSGPWLRAKAQGRPALPVWQCAPADAAARGAALAAGAAAGWWPVPGAGPRPALARVPSG